MKIETSTTVPRTLLNWRVGDKSLTETFTAERWKFVAGKFTRISSVEVTK